MLIITHLILKNNLVLCAQQLSPTFAFHPADCPSHRGQNPEKNTLSFFRRNFTPAKSEMQGVFFLSGLPPSPRGGDGAIRRAYDLISLHHALRA